MPVVASNYFKGRFDINKIPVKPDMIVIHVAVANLLGCYNTFNNPLEQKSSHYCIDDKDPTIWQFVDEKDNAWHAGFVLNPTSRLVRERLGKYPSPNAYTIGIENAGNYAGDSTPDDFTDSQYELNGWLVSDCSKRWNIPLDRDHIIGHKEIRIDKTCPGIRVSIDRIISIAKKYSVDQPSPSGDVAKATALIEEAVGILKKINS